MKTLTATTALLSLIPLLLFGTAAPAQVQAWTTIGQWQVYFDPAAYGCVARAQYHDGLEFFIGLDTREETRLYVMLTNENWETIEDGATYDLSINFIGGFTWHLEMDATNKNGFKSLRSDIPTYTDEAHKFANDFSKSGAMDWIYDGAPIGEMMLSGSDLVLDEVTFCTEHYRVNGQPKIERIRY